MPLTLKNAKLEADKWYELHQLISEIKGSAVTLDKALSFDQLTPGEIHVCISAAEPVEPDYGYKLVRSYGGAECGANEPGGFWVKAVSLDALINISEV